jgi:hypothetical protein
MLVQRSGAPVVTVSVEDRDPTRVKVAISEDVPFAFDGLFANSKAPMLRQATAVSQVAQPVCLLVLNPSDPEALRLKGSPAIKTDACTVQVNSKASNAVTVGGSASITATAIYVSGPPSPDGKITPKPQYNQPAVQDPLADKISWPSAGTCDAARTNYEAKKGVSEIEPGNYCGGMDFASGAKVTLKPGTYVVQSGSVSFGANADVSGPGGVTLVLLDPKGAIDMQGGPDVNLQAPTSGPWKGVVLAIKPQPSKVMSTMNGGGSLTLGGIVYLPTQHLEIRGGGSLDGLPMSRGFVVDTINIQGSGEMTLAGDENLQGQQRNPRLVY